MYILWCSPAGLDQREQCTCHCVQGQPAPTPGTGVHVHVYVLYMYNQLQRQGKCKQRHLKTTLFFLKRKRRAASGGTRTRDVLHSGQMLYQLSHQGSSAGWAESLKLIQGKWRLTPDKQGYSTSALYMHTACTWLLNLNLMVMHTV